MAQNEVTKRFLSCLQHLIKSGKINSHRQFALSVDYLPQSLSEVLHGRRDVPLEILMRAVETWQFNAVYLLNGQGDFIASPSNNDLRTLTVVTNEEGNERIVHVPIAAQAGYLTDMLDPIFMRNLPTFTLPGYQYDQQTYRCFDVSGDSMEPTLFEGDKLVCYYLEPHLWNVALRNRHVYVVAMRGDLLVKRVNVLPRDQKSISLISDNPFYPPTVVPFSEVKEIWYVRTKISPFLHAPPRNENGELQQQLANQQQQLQALIRKLGLN